MLSEERIGGRRVGGWDSDTRRMRMRLEIGERMRDKRARINIDTIHFLIHRSMVTEGSRRHPGERLCDESRYPGRG